MLFEKVAIGIILFLMAVVVTGFCIMLYDEYLRRK